MNLATTILVVFLGLIAVSIIRLLEEHRKLTQIKRMTLIENLHCAPSHIEQLKSSGWEVTG